MLAAFLSAVVLGFFVGALARFAVPGPDPMPAWLTILIGLTGSLIGGTVAAAAVGTSDRNDAFVVLLSSVFAATLLVIAYRRFIQQRPITGPEARRLPTRGFGIARLRRRLEGLGVDPNSVGAPGGAKPVPRDEPESADTAENLRKLEDLHDAGVLNDEEFEAKREQLLARM
jgi:uncharacterized membrane protein YeaQ/YmgE (transglycosylase-associated protein family)